MRLIILVLFVIYPSIIFPMSLKGLNGLYATGLDISSDGTYGVVLSYGNGKDCFTRYDATVFGAKKTMEHCGLFNRNSAESIAIINEEPMTVLISAEGYKSYIICDWEGYVYCDKIENDSFIKSGLKEISGMDFSKDGLLYAVNDNDKFLYVYKFMFYNIEYLTKINLPWYLHQAEGLSIDQCFNDVLGRDCVYIADVGLYGTDNLFIYNISRRSWDVRYLDFQEKGKDIESVGTTVIDGVVNLILISKTKEAKITVIQLKD